MHYIITGFHLRHHNISSASHQIEKQPRHCFPVKCILGTRLSEADGGKRISICDLPGDILIIPQATLGGRPKGKLMQYHGNVEKSTGETLYSTLVTRCQSGLESGTKAQERGVKVKWGTYGNRQVFRMDTNGPYSHLVEF